jgi:hypothetical protein
VGKHFLERDDLLFRLVSSVVDKDVDNWNFLLQPFPEIAIRLIADEYPSSLIFIRFTFLLNVHADHATTWPKIVLPHPQATAAENSDFQHRYFAPAKLLEVSMVDVEVVFPLPDTRAFVVCLVVFQQWVGLGFACLARGVRVCVSVKTVPLLRIRKASFRRHEISQQTSVYGWSSYITTQQLGE